MKIFIRATVTLGATLAMAAAVVAADTRPMTRVLQGASAIPANANRATAGTAIQAAMTAGHTGLFRHSTIRLNGGGTIETLAVVEGGRMTDLHARRSGSFLPRRPGSGIRAASAATFQSLIGYGLDAPITDAARRTAFLATARGTSGGTTAPAPAPACPANFATAAPLKQQMLLQQAAYAGCRLSALPGDRLIQVAARGMVDLFGIPTAAASDWSMIWFEVSSSAFFDSWGFEYQPGEYVAVNVGGARGVWANTGG